jgi:hypothetical protein
MTLGTTKGNGIVKIEIDWLAGTFNDKFKAAHAVHPFGRTLNDFRRWQSFRLWFPAGK